MACRIFLQPVKGTFKVPQCFLPFTGCKKSGQICAQPGTFLPGIMNNIRRQFIYIQYIFRLSYHGIIVAETVLKQLREEGKRLAF